MKSCFYGITLMILWKKKPCKKFGVVFIRSRKVMKLQSSESRVRDATPANVQNISPLVFFTYFC